MKINVTKSFLHYPVKFKYPPPPEVNCSQNSLNEDVDLSDTPMIYFTMDPANKFYWNTPKIYWQTWMAVKY